MLGEPQQFMCGYNHQSFILEGNREHLPHNIRLRRCYFVPLRPCINGRKKSKMKSKLIKFNLWKNTFHSSKDTQHHRYGGNDYSYVGWVFQQATGPRKNAKRNAHHERTDSCRESYNTRIIWDDTPCSAAHIRLSLTRIRSVLGELQQFISSWKHNINCLLTVDLSLPSRWGTKNIGSPSIWNGLNPNKV